MDDTESGAPTTASDSYASEDGLRPDELRFAPGTSVAYGSSICVYSLGGKSDAVDRALSIGAWSILVAGLLTALVLAAYDPLSLGDNVLNALYKYLSVVGYAEAALLLALKVSYPSRDAVSRVLRFQSRRVPSTLVRDGSVSLRLKGDVVQRSLNGAGDASVVEAVAEVADSLAGSWDSVQGLKTQVGELLAAREQAPGYDKFTWESVQTNAMKVVVKAPEMPGRAERMALFHEALMDRIASIQVVGGNDLVMAALARLSVVDAPRALALLHKWCVEETARFRGEEEGSEEGSGTGENVALLQSPPVVLVPSGCVLRRVCIFSLADIDAAFEARGMVAVVEFQKWSVRLGFGRHAPLRPLKVWETAEGTLLTRIGALSILRNEPLYFALQAVAFFLYPAAPWLVSLSRSRGDSSYLSRAADAAGIGTALFAGFAYLADTFGRGSGCCGLG